MRPACAGGRGQEARTQAGDTPYRPPGPGLLSLPPGAPPPQASACGLDTRGPPPVNAVHLLLSVGPGPLLPTPQATLAAQTQLPEDPLGSRSPGGAGVWAGLRTGKEGGTEMD